MQLLPIGVARDFNKLSLGSVFLCDYGEGPIAYLRCQAPWENKDGDAGVGLGDFAAELDPQGRDYKGVPGRRDATVFSQNTCFELSNISLQLDQTSINLSSRRVQSGQVLMIERTPYIVVANGGRGGQYMVDAETGICLQGDAITSPVATFSRWSVVRRIGDKIETIVSFGG